MQKGSFKTLRSLSQEPGVSDGVKTLGGPDGGEGERKTRRMAASRRKRAEYGRMPGETMTIALARYNRDGQDGVEICVNLYCGVGEGVVNAVFPSGMSQAEMAKQFASMAYYVRKLKPSKRKFRRLASSARINLGSK